ncbi:hypothetical protein EVG20_g2499 [Dentipellis fragilis]|uniref:Uncharacterized protein n=1 Tax=Dentipellis fragilis TaxID=205917 RepID=A0A4Y9Z9N9_9AGAM|nr:hypothetical protein EVG20_g2499 [Dentipellis fragilis]
MTLKPFDLRIQHGITGGFAPPRPSAVYDLSLSTQSPNSILLSSQFREDGTPDLLPLAPKAVGISSDTESLVEELKGILKDLPTQNPPQADIYGKDIGIFWQSDDFQWMNSAPQGCGGFDDGTTVTADDKKKFERAVDIVDTLVKRGIAHEG